MYNKFRERVLDAEHQSLKIVMVSRCALVSLQPSLDESGDSTSERNIPNVSNKRGEPQLLNS